MDTSLFLLGLLELVLSIVIGVLALYLGYSILYRTIAKRFHIDESNTSFAIVVAAVIISVGMLLGALIDPIFATIRLLTREIADTGTLVLETAKYLGKYLVIGILVSGFVNLLSIWFYTVLTKVHEFEEIAKNNVAIGIVTGAVIITMTLLAMDALVLMVESMMPLPEMFER